jgi:hypothetical protein
MNNENKIAKISAFWYLSISIVSATLFYIVTSIGQYPITARIGGALWIFLLVLIISMPIIIPKIKKRYQ